MAMLPRFSIPVVLFGLGFAACSGDEGGTSAGTDAGSGGTTETTSSGGSAGTGTASASGTGSSGGGSTGASSATGGGSAGTSTGTGSGSSGTGGGTSACEVWNAARVDLSEGTWSGSLGGCDPGDISAEGRAHALAVTNMYRELAGLPAVATDPTWDADAQACALVMDANGMLSHDPPQNWTCWSMAAADAAGSSNIAGTPGVSAVDLYMVDPGNPSTMGHRRWILSNVIGPIGLGSTDAMSCMKVIGGDGDAGKEWTAWPPPGEFPFQAVMPSWESIDVTGWTIQSDTIDLGSATVTVTAGGSDLPVTVAPLAPGYGSEYAISFIPQGWTTASGTTYHVEVGGVAAPISYDVSVVDCP